jgi:hypothetical protein
VALVEAYLQVNGYFTVAEYPVIELSRRGPPRAATDIDIMAFRFPHAGHEVAAKARTASGTAFFATDPALGCPRGQADMIVGEVKEGQARFNPSARDPLVLATALSRFGCCTVDEAAPLVRSLLGRGQAVTGAGHLVRMVAFGSKDGDGGVPVSRRVLMDDVLRFLDSYLSDHWETLRHAQLKHPALALLALVRKAKSGRAPDR